jgi:Tfp pilus assembly protein PilF
MRRWRGLPVGALAGVLLVAGGVGSLVVAAVTQAVAGDPLGALGFRATAGATPGYIDDRACSAGGCHAELCRSFGEMDKAWSFHRPRAERFSEDLNAPAFVHEPSKRQYELRKVGEKLVFAWSQLGGGGQIVNRLEQEVHYIQGAGTLARTYLFRTPGGEIYQLPIAWYTKTRRFAMAPGFDRPDHEGVQRRVRRECQFCHNAYAELPPGGDAFVAPQVFPAELPEGIGCQRCHGPGAEHTRLGLLAQRTGSGVTAEALRASTVNPARLSPALHNDVCNQCHARQSLAIPGMVRFGRGDFSFRPGELLADYLVQVQVKKTEADPIGHVGAISHPYRMEASRCFTESKGALTCTMCHDSHRRLSAEQKGDRCRAACLGCHREKGCSRKADGQEAGDASTAFSGNCIGCHMPARPSNVLDFPVTDHLIVRRHKDLDVVPQPRRSDPVISEASVSEPSGAMGELYRATAIVRATGGRDAIIALSRAIKANQSSALEPHLVLASGLLSTQRWSDAEAVLQRTLQLSPQLPQALEWLALARGPQGRLEDAVRLLRGIIPREPSSPEPRYNLGLFLEGLGQHQESATALEGALALRPNMPLAWYHLGNAYVHLGRLADAVTAYRRALALDPSYGNAYVRSAQVLERLGKTDDARQLLEHGAKVARKAEIVTEALQKLNGPAKPAPATD